MRARERSGAGNKRQQRACIVRVPLGAAIVDFGKRIAGVARFRALSLLFTLAAQAIGSRHAMYTFHEAFTLRHRCLAVPRQLRMRQLGVHVDLCCRGRSDGTGIVVHIDEPAHDGWSDRRRNGVRLPHRQHGPALSSARIGHAEYGIDERWPRRRGDDVERWFERKHERRKSARLFLWRFERSKQFERWHERWKSARLVVRR